MGCLSSKGQTVETNRRRLSVGNANASDNMGQDTGGKGAIQDDELLKTEVVDLVQEFEVESGESGEDAKTRFSLIGSTTDTGTTNFANKTITTEGKDIDFNEIGIGYTCRKGLKPESPNQDSWFIFKHEKFSMYAVLDGHGQKGHDVSDLVKRTLPKLILKDPRSRSSDKWGEVLTDAFIKVQGMVVDLDSKKKLSAQLSGTTATVAVHDHQTNKITVAHVADSTAVQGFKQNNGAYRGVAITRDHKPELKDEKARIEKAGGRVVFDGYANHRVYARNAKYPGLNMSRCLGDLLGHHNCGISCEPEISIVEVEPGKEQILLVCSDGVWEFIEPNAAVTQVTKSLASKNPSAQVAADALAKDAWDQWIEKEGGAVVDDITVILVQLGKDGSRCDP
eukprot:TRINITY_DN1978_c0_g1_i1.p1 TRINITY_DN1978_c0_g1~~TRINITY_DN1978_c0_g1_i1.p1  ORF type:complete len:394 (-),score=77.54 TRINITY_DN1978_c0_g1_i1:211-1392(-)